VCSSDLVLKDRDAFIDGIPLDPDEVFPVTVRFELRKDYTPPRGGVAQFDLVQAGTPADPDAVVGGQRFSVDFNKLVLVRAGETWRYLDNGGDPGPGWASVDYDDGKWREGRAELGYGDDPATVIDGGNADKHAITTYYRRSFDVDDPAFYRSLTLRLKRDDGAIVYLNGAEVQRVNLPAAADSSTAATRSVSGIEEETFFPLTLKPGQLLKGRNVVAVEIHQDSERADDSTFDLELTANREVPLFPPNVRFAVPFDGALWQSGEPMPVSVEALDSDGSIKSVSLFADGKLISTDDAAPFDFAWADAPLGSHRLRAVATDADGLQSVSDVTATVVENTPPVVNLLAPVDGAMFNVGDTILAQAEASDPRGSVDRVEFWLHEGDRFDTPDRLVGTDTTAPYTAAITGLAAGNYMLRAVAYDDKGLSSVSWNIMFMVHDHGSLKMRHAGGSASAKKSSARK